MGGGDEREGRRKAGKVKIRQANCTLREMEAVLFALIWRLEMFGGAVRNCSA